jgi:hypothetical protein
VSLRLSRCLTETIFAISEHETTHSAIPRPCAISSALQINDKRSCRRADDRQGFRNLNQEVGSRACKDAS